MMKARKSLLLAIGLLAFAFSPASSAQAVAGSWTIRAADAPDRVQLTLVYGRSHESSDSWRLASLKGLDLAPAAKHDVHFTIQGDAGKVEAEGSATAGTAAGGFQFTPDSGYAAELRKLGLGEINPDTQIAFVLQDVGLDFARQMIAFKIAGLTADKLLAMRIHGLEPAYVKDLRSAGAQAADADQLIAFRIHKVTPALVAALHQGGGVPDDSHLVALAIHGATPDWAADLGKLGYLKAASADQLIAFRIHGVTPDYIEGIEKQGYDHPSPDQLITMKIHGVTPDYIASVKAKGIKDVSLDQMVAMKIHGID